MCVEPKFSPEASVWDTDIYDPCRRVPDVGGHGGANVTTGHSGSGLTVSLEWE